MFVSPDPASAVWDRLESLAQEAGDRSSIRFGRDPAVTRADLLARARRVATGMRARGVGPGDRVAIMAGNRLELVETWLATLRTGAVLVPLNTSMRGDILTHMLRVAEPRLTIVEAGLVDVVRAAQRADRSGDRMVVLDDGNGCAAGWSELHGFGEDSETPWARRPDHPAAVLFTSGTTGPSKGVIWTESTALALAAGAQEVGGCTAEDVSYVTLPLFHANGLFVSLLPALLCGASTVVDQRFSVSAFWPRVRETGATVTSLLGIMAPLLLGAPPRLGDRQHRLERAFVVPAPTETPAFEERFGLSVRTFYALTDVGMPIGAPSGSARPSGSCGKELSSWECLLVGDDDRPVAPGEPGELVVRPRKPWISSQGYWGNDAATVAAWRNLWFHTGDLMTRDADGWFYFRDRTKDAIRRSGENVSSFEVEAVLQDHPGIAEAAVFAVPSDLAEDEVMAAVVPSDPTLTADEVANFCRSRLPYFAVPRFVELIGTLPRTPSQKIRKEELRRRGVTAATVDVGRTGRDGRPTAFESREPAC